MKFKKRIMPSDYERLTITLPKDFNKVELMAEIEEVTDLLNERKKEDEMFMKSNKVILECLQIGLKAMRKRHSS